MDFILDRYIKKNKYAYHFGYRKEYKLRKLDDCNINVVLCSITRSDELQFSLGADILEKQIKTDEKVFIDRAVIWSVRMFKDIGINKSMYASIPVRNYDLILISGYMIFQVLNIVPFLLQSKINPLKEKRDEVIILGGNNVLKYEILEDYIDVFYFGDGEVYINEIINIRRRNKNKKDFIKELRDTEGIKDCIYTGIEDKIKPAINREIGTVILNSNDFVTKPTNKVLEIARSCKYNCYFCFLNNYKYPFRTNKIEDIENAVKTYKKGTCIYPFAPDESSFKKKLELIEIINKYECKAYSYNKRFDNFTEDDIKGIQATSRVVFGLDGISQRMRDFANKQITLEQIYRVFDIVLKNKKISLLKLNIIFSYFCENNEDWLEFEELLLYLCEKRKKYRTIFKEGGQRIYQRIRNGEKIVDNLMIQIAPTPFIPEIGTPFEFMKAVYIESTKERLEKLVYRVKVEYSFVKMEGLNGVSGWQAETILQRIGTEGKEAVKKWLRLNGVRQFSNQLEKKFINFLKLNGLNIDSYLEEQRVILGDKVKFKYNQEKRYKLYKNALCKLKQ